MLGYLPAKFKIRFLEPIDTDESAARSRATTRRWCRRSPQEVRARIQEELYEMLAQAQVGLVRMSAAMSSRPTAVLITGLSTYWGGRLAQALERDRARRGDHRRRHPTTRRASSSAPSS